MRRGLAVATVVLLALGLVLASASGGLVRAIEREVESALASTLPVPIAYEGVAVELVPPRVTLRRPSVTRDGRVVASAESLAVGLAVGPSVWEGEWLLDVDVDAPFAEVDVSHPWWSAVERGGDGGPSAGVRRLAVRGGKAVVRFPDEDLSATFADVAVSVRTHGVVVAAAEFVARANGTIERAGRRFAVDELAFGGKLEGGRWLVDRARVTAGETRLRGSGSLDGDELAASLQGALDLPSIFALVPEAGEVSGRARIHADVSATLSEPILAAEIEVDRLRIDRIEISGRTPFRARGRDWELGPGKLAIFGGTIDAKAHGRLAPDVPYALEGRMAGWDPSVFLAALDLELPLRGAIDGDGTLRGRLLGKEMEGDARFQVRAEGRSARGESSFRISPAKDSIAVAIRPAGGGEIRAQDEIASGRHRGEVVARELDLAEISPFLGLTIAGIVEGEGAIRDAAPVLDGRGAVRALVVDGVVIGDVAGPFELSPRGFSSESLAVRDLGAVASGTASFEPAEIGDVRVVLTDASIERWSALARHFWPAVPTATGHASGEARVSGSSGSPKIGLDLKATEATLAGEALGAVDVSLDRSGDGAKLNVDAVAANGNRATLALAQDASERLDGKIVVPRWSLGELEALANGGSGVRGVVHLDGTVKGTLERPIAVGTARIEGGSVAGIELGAISGDVRVGDRKAVVNLDASSGVKTTIEASLQPPHRFEARATWSDFLFAPEVSRERRLEIGSAGAAELSGDASQPLGRGFVRADRLTIRHPGGALENPRPWLVRIEAGAARLDEGALEGPGQRLVLAGRASASAYRLRATGEASLALAEGWVPGLVSSRGLVVIDLTAEGVPGRRPRVRGSARVRDAAADLGVVVGLTDVAGALDFRDEDVSIRDLVGAVGGGRFAIDGSISEAGTLALRWQLRRASLGVPEWLDHRVTGEGTVTGPFAEPLVDGRLAVEQAIYDQNVEWGEFLPWFRRHTRLPPAQRAIPLRFDLRLVADDSIFVENNLAKIELSANLHLGGDLARPALDGRIAVREGRINFRGRVFELTGGELRFEEARPFDPVIDVRGESQIRTPEDEIEVGLHVSGTAENPRIELTSDDPSLTRNDLLALVTFGRTMSQLQTSGGAGVSLDELLSLTAGERGDRLGSDVQRILPVDRIEIESAYSRTSGTTEPRVRIGKDLTQSVRSSPLRGTLTGPMRASVGSSLGTGRERDVTLEYDLTRSISIEGLWESQTESGAGAFGADVKFRVPFWRTPFSLLPTWLRPARESAALP